MFKLYMSKNKESMRANKLGVKLMSYNKLTVEESSHDAQIENITKNIIQSESRKIMAPFQCDILKHQAAFALFCLNQKRTNRSKIELKKKIF